MELIANRDLSLAVIPPPTADYLTIAKFALTFDGYEAWGSFEKCAEVAGARLSSTLTELRTCLFFEQRGWRNVDSDPDAEGMAYMRSLIEKIRGKVASGECD